MIKRSSRTFRKNGRRGGGRVIRQTDRKTRRSKHRGGFGESIGRGLKSLGKGIKRSARSLRLKKNYSEAQRNKFDIVYDNIKSDFPDSYRGKISSIDAYNAEKGKFSVGRKIKFLEDMMDNEDTRKIIQDYLKNELDTEYGREERKGASIETLTKILKKYTSSKIKVREGDTKAIKESIAKLKKGKTAKEEEEKESKKTAEDIARTQELEIDDILKGLEELVDKLCSEVERRFKAGESVKDVINIYCEILSNIKGILDELDELGKSIKSKQYKKIQGQLSTISKSGEKILEKLKKVDEAEIDELRGKIEKFKEETRRVVNWEEENPSIKEKHMLELFNRINAFHREKFIFSEADHIHNQQLLGLMNRPNETLELIKKETNLDLEEDYTRGYSLINTKALEKSEDHDKHLSTVDVYDIYLIGGDHLHRRAGGDTDDSDELQNPIEQFKRVQNKFGKKRKMTGARTCEHAASLYADVENKETCLSRFGDHLQCLPPGSMVFSIDISPGEGEEKKVFEWLMDEEKDEFNWLMRNDEEIGATYLKKIQKTPKAMINHVANKYKDKDMLLEENHCLSEHTEKFDTLMEQYDKIRNFSKKSQLGAAKKKLAKYKDPDNGKYNVSDIESSDCPLLGELYKDLIELTKDKIGELDVLSGGGQNGGAPKNDIDFYKESKSTDDLDLSEYEDFIQRKKELYELSVYSEPSEPDELILRGPVMIGLLNKDNTTYTFMKIDCDVKLGRKSEDGNGTKKAGVVTFSKKYGIETMNSDDFEKAVKGGKLKYFYDRAKHGGLELLACLLKSDLNKLAIDCYDNGKLDEDNRVGMRDLARKIETVNRIIKANRKNNKIKGILEEFKKKSEQNQDTSLKAHLNSQLKGDSDTKSEILEHYAKEQKDMEDKKKAIMDAAKHLQGKQVRIGIAKKPMRFYYADSKCYNGLINYLYDYDDENNNKCRPYKINRPESRSDDWDKFFTDGKADSSAASKALDWATGTKYLNGAIDRDDADYRRRLENEKQKILQEIKEYYSDSKPITHGEFKRKLFQLHRYNDLIESIDIKSNQDKYSQLHKNSDVDGGDSSGEGMDGGAGEPKIIYMNPLVTPVNELSDKLPDGWIFIGIPMTDVNQFCVDHINKGNDEPHTINKVDYINKDMGRDFRFYSNLILINPNNNGQQTDKWGMPVNISEFIILPPNICLDLGGSDGKVGGGGNWESWGGDTDSFFKKFKHWLKIFATNMIIKYIIKRILLSVLKFALTIAIGMIFPWSIPFLTVTGLANNSNSSISGFFGSIGSLFGIGGGITGGSITGGGMKMLTDGKYQKPKRTKKTKRRKRKITKKPSRKR